MGFELLQLHVLDDSTHFLFRTTEINFPMLNHALLRGSAWAAHWGNHLIIDFGSGCNLKIVRFFSLFPSDPSPSPHALPLSQQTHKSLSPKNHVLLR